MLFAKHSKTYGSMYMYYTYVIHKALTHSSDLTRISDYIWAGPISGSVCAQMSMACAGDRIKLTQKL